MLTYQSLPVELQTRLNLIIQKLKGKSQAARFFGCTRQTIKAAAGGVPVHQWTARTVAEKIAERDAAGKTP